MVTHGLDCTLTPAAPPSTWFELQPVLSGGQDWPSYLAENAGLDGYPPSVSQALYEAFDPRLQLDPAQPAVLFGGTSDDWLDEFLTGPPG
jgi:hypothetical protein